MTHFRFRYKVQGSHVHIRMFTAQSNIQPLYKMPELTHGNCGTLIMPIVEWEEFRELLEKASESATAFKAGGLGRHSFQFVDEGEAHHHD